MPFTEIFAWTEMNNSLKARNSITIQLIDTKVAFVNSRKPTLTQRPQ